MLSLEEQLEAQKEQAKLLQAKQDAVTKGHTPYADQSARGTHQPPTTAGPMQIQQQPTTAQMQNTPFQQSIQQQLYTPPPASSTTWNISTTGSSPEYCEDLEVSKIVKRIDKSYFSIITVDVHDQVFYRVWKGGFIPYFFAKVFGRFGIDIHGNRDSWQHAPVRTHLPATLGAAYEAIAEAIKEYQDEQEHSRHIKELLKTEPENLKMIGGLERLQEGPHARTPSPPSPCVGGSIHNISNTYKPCVGGSIHNISNTYKPGAVSFISSDDLAFNSGEIMATKIILNGKDIEESMAERIGAATEEIKADLNNKLKDKGEQ